MPRPAPSSLAELAKHIDVRIDQLLSAELARWSAVEASLVEPLEELRRLVFSGGKRLRPAFCRWAFTGAGGDPDDPVVVETGAALELLHTFALVHDDVMDGSTTRRGSPTVNATFEHNHRSAGWRGDAHRFGEGVAILVGDLAFVYADLLMADAPRKAIGVWNDLRLEVNVGQYLDLVGTVRGRPTVEASRRICRYKTGKYTVERPLHLGAALAGALDELAAPLSHYGLPLGEAFQLRDDLLGAFGDSSLTGKPVGEDLREGKPTGLVARALDLGDQATERRLLDALGRPDLTEEDIAELQQLLAETGAQAAVEAEIERLVDEACTAIRSAPLSSEARAELADLAAFVALRDH